MKNIVPRVVVSGRPGSHSGGMDDLKQRVALAVRSARRTKDISQEKLAADLEVSVEALSNIERARSTPSLHMFTALARALDLDVVELLNAPASDRDQSAKRIALEADAAVVLDGMDDDELARWVRVGKAL